MPTINELVIQKTVFVEACGDRKAMGEKYVFGSHPDYIGDVCEMPLDIAKRLIDAELRQEKEHAESIKSFNDRLRASQRDVNVKPPKGHPPQSYKAIWRYAKEKQAKKTDK